MGSGRQAFGLERPGEVDNGLAGGRRLEGPMDRRPPDDTPSVSTASPRHQAAKTAAAKPTKVVYPSQSLPIFRREFPAEKPVARAVLYACGLGQAEFRLNGRRSAMICSSPVGPTIARAASIKPMT